MIDSCITKNIFGGEDRARGYRMVLATTHRDPP